VIKDYFAETLLKLGFTAILLGYLLVWLPQPVVGLSFIGLELGEWVKFLPQVRSGEIIADRNLFYVPPITLSLMIILWTANWPNRRWQTWVMRGLALLVALLAFPAIEAIRDEPADQWLLRIGVIIGIVIIALLIPLLRRLPIRMLEILSWSGICLLALLGLGLPTWAYLSFLPAISELIGQKVGIGPGVWLNIFGNFSVGLTALYFLGLWRVLQKKNL
jgi:hypothetical protein